MSYVPPEVDPLMAYYLGQGDYAGINAPAFDPAMMQAMMGFVPTQTPSGRDVTYSQQASLLNSYGNLMFDSPMMAMGGAQAFAPGTFEPTVSTTPIDAPMFQAFTGYLRDETTFEGAVASELINGGSASGAVQKMRAFIEANPDDPEAQRMIQLLPPVPYDAMADPEAPPQVDWSEAQNNARRIEEQFYVMPSAQRALLPQVLDPNAAPGATVPTEDGEISLGVDEMGNPVIMQTTATPTEQGQKFADLGLSLPTDTYQTEDFLPPGWEEAQQGYEQSTLPAVQQAMQAWMGEKPTLGNPPRPREGLELPEDQQAGQANAVTPEERAAEALYRVLYDPNQISNMAGDFSGMLGTLAGGVADVGSEVLAPLSGAWQGAGGGGGIPRPDEMAETVFGGLGGLFAGTPEGVEGMAYLEQMRRQQAAQELARAAGGQPAQDDGGGGLFGNIWDAITDTASAGGSAGAVVPGGDEAWNRITGGQAPPMQVDYGSSPATYEELLTQLGFPTGEPTPPYVYGGSTPGPERPRGVQPGATPPYVYSGGYTMPGPERPRPVEPGGQPPYVYGGGGYPTIDAMLAMLLPGNDQRSTSLPPYAQQGAQPANQPGGAAYLNQAPTPPPGAQPARQPGGPEYLQEMETGEQRREDEKSAQILGGSTDRRGIRRRATRSPESARRYRAAFEEWDRLTDEAFREKQQLYGADQGYAMGLAAGLRAQGQTPYLQQMMARRMTAMAMGMPNSGYLPGT